MKDMHCNTCFCPIDEAWERKDGRAFCSDFCLESYLELKEAFGEDSLP